MAWCKRNRINDVFGLAGNKALLRQVTVLAEDVAMARIEKPDKKIRHNNTVRYGADSWKAERQVVARIVASSKGADSRFFVINPTVTARWL